MAVEPAVFCAVHWYQAASLYLAREMSSVEAPLESVVICTSGLDEMVTPSCGYFPNDNIYIIRNLDDLE